MTRAGRTWRWRSRIPGHHALAELERRAPGVHAHHPEHRWAARSRRQPEHPETPRRHLGGALHRCGQECYEESGRRCPTCRRRCECGAMLRPAVVWFGEFLPPGVWSKAEIAASRAEVFLIIGTSAAVQPAAGLIDVARWGGAITVEINPQPDSVLGPGRLLAAGPAGEILPALLWNLRRPGSFLNRRSGDPLPPGAPSRPAR